MGLLAVLISLVELIGDEVDMLLSLLLTVGGVREVSESIDVALVGDAVAVLYSVTPIDGVVREISDIVELLRVLVSVNVIV